MFSRYFLDEIDPAMWGSRARCQLPGSNLVSEGLLRSIRLGDYGEYKVHIGNEIFLAYADFSIEVDW